MTTRKLLLLAAAAALLVSCGEEASKQAAEADPSFAFNVEQVRFENQGVFPFDLLVGKAFVVSDKPIPSNDTFWPDPDSTALKVFEDGISRPVLQIHPFAQEAGKLNLLTIVPVTQSLAVGPGGGVAFEPGLIKTLDRLADGYEQGFYNLAVVFCWGSTERRYAFMDKEGLADIRAELAGLTFPGPPSGSWMDCMEPALADLTWLQQADAEVADEAARQRGTLPLYFKGDQNRRTEVLLITDGVPFREGPLSRFSDLLVQGNLPLYTVGVGVNAQGARGLSRLEELYQRRRLGGAIRSVPDHEALLVATEDLVDSWLSQTRSYVVTFLSGFSGERGAELSLWASWKDGQYTSRELRVAPGRYQGALRWVFRGIVLALLLGMGVYILYRLRVWPFADDTHLAPCPEGCGHLIPETWSVCRFCELRGVWGRLVLLNGDRAGHIYYLKDDLYAIGSSPGDDIVLTHLKAYPVAPGHAELHRLEGGEKIALKLAGSPVTVGSRPFDGRGVVNLRYGDVLQFGDKGVATILLRGVERLG